MTALYNEINPAAAAVLQLYIDEGIIAPGKVDTRSIKELTVDDLKGYTQIHFFAGAGIWSYGIRRAGWPDNRPIWTASCPCQPFSVAGERAGVDDPRHLWPDLLRLIRAARVAGYGPPVIMGEQVGGKAGNGWFDGVRADLAAEGIASRSRDIPACAVDAPHERNRLYWIAVADADDAARRDGLARAAGGERREPANGDAPAGAMVDAARKRRREGGAEAGVFGRRPAAAGADVRDGRESHVGDAESAGREGLGRHGDRGREPGRRPDRNAGPREAPAAGRSTAPADGGNRQGDLADTHISNQRRHAGKPRGPAREGEGAARPQNGYAAERRDGARPRGDDHSSTRPNGTFWSDACWIVCHDKKARRAKPGISMLVDGMVGRIDLWSLAGNSVLPQLVETHARAFLEAEQEVSR